MKKLFVVFLLSLVTFPVFASNWRDWESFSVPKGNEQHWICGMATVNRTDPETNASIKLIESTPFIQFDLYKGSWSFPEGTSVAVRLDFDDNEPLDLTAYGDGKIVSIAIPVELTSVFLSLVNDRQYIRVFFREGNEKTWTIGLDGARSSLLRMLSCFKHNRVSQGGAVTGD
ncbi:hypothetical protein [Oxalobacter formigenes]|uniref:Invasion associated locus B (IalB) protein n=1 Tax=Oxalobacter formigenes OXCC13 TaxID=556269 RepID=C3X8V1_OXAFO|nr:hypothetical protein [Oxalobacter formigenes]ARQ46317.1 hypothetical protein BRW83_1576 [Oxalobacter formigenes]ARQ78435.1 hypothetical protein BRW84_07295 [Oxalobacter formigenes OXCC13]EEO29627.1 hypothetical protein OFBG_00655 [Oxalobacter formigenes OXCC13]MCZ4062990.1 hypothetical protein [Oxalobacter formigenes]QDX32984.1 hypothetical protein FPZ51_04985 [Oxalobacter formigenes]